MNDIYQILGCLRQTPLLLENLLAGIPAGTLKHRRIADRWSIHEHACHLAVVQPMVSDRFVRCLRDPQPRVEAYRPGQTDPDTNLLAMDLPEALVRFSRAREAMAQLVKGQDEGFWHKPVHHPEYAPYTPYILLRHILMHDHVHMYRIEELWLTRDTVLEGQSAPGEAV